jgi:signal transduction histidine kinase
MATASFRLTAAYLAIFTLSVVILGAVVYFSVGHEMARDSDKRVAAEVESLQAVFRADGMEQLAQIVRARAGGAAAFDYRLEDGEGRLLAGDLPSPASRAEGDAARWVRFADSDRDPGAEEEVAGERALVVRLDNRATLAVGEERNGVHGARRAILTAFSWSLAAAIALGSIGGLALSGAFLRRIEAMTTTANGIIAGDLSRRIPDAEVDDDLGRLAATFNRMLDRMGSLLEANKHVSAGIAHDLRSPMARVLRRLEGARTHGADLTEYEGAVDASIGEIHRILETFNALLRIGQIETGARRAGFKSVDLAAIALEVAEAFQPAAVDEGKTLAIALGAALPILGDRELLTQLAANLIDNAIRHTPSGSRIEVSSARTRNCWQLSVADDGPGVPLSDRSRIFERFHRIGSAQAKPGNGFGLSLVAAIAELHGGQVSAADNRPGLKIVFEIPLSSSSDANY